MKLILQVVFYLLFLFNLNAQPIQSGRAIYSFSHIKDTLAPTNKYLEEMVLYFNVKQSSYFSYTKFYGDSILQARLKIVESGGKISEEEFKDALKFKVTTPENLYFNFEKSKFLFTHPWIGETLAIENKTDIIKWQLQDSTKTIEGLICFKAVCRYKGRNYDVWYCPEIPTKAGPWKLNGLPGLIIQAKDQTGSIEFSLKSVNYSKEIFSLINPPNLIRQVSLDQFNKLKIGVLQNPQAYINAAVTGSSISTSNDKVEVRKTDATAPKPKSRLNNPIELNND